MTTIPRQDARFAVAVALSAGLAFTAAVPPGRVVAQVARAVPAAIERQLEHYARVEGELRRAPVAHLTDEQRAARARAIELLHQYRMERTFGVNTDFPGTNTPYFVDRGGRRCAVAYLLDRTGAADLTLRVAREANHAWVADLVDDRELAAWLGRHGLTVEEAARIQVPGTRTQQPPPVEPTSPTPTWSPGDGMGSNWAATTSPGGDARGRPSPVRPVSPSVGTRAAAARGGVPVVELAAETWQEWWTWNRAAYLEEVVAARPARPVTGSGDRLRFSRWGVPSERDALLPVLRHALADGDPGVRAAACVSLGRLGGREDVPLLRDRLRDSSLAVRHEAILALGATGQATAVHLLSKLALSGRAAAGTRAEAEPVSVFARPLAIVALGLAQREGATAMSDGLVRALCAADHGEEENDRVRFAAMLYAELTGTPRLDDLELTLAADTELDRAVRARAVEGLDFDDARARHALLTALAGRDLTLRRSAALALGTAEDDLALPSLMTAFELEREQFTRATLLLAIGRHGGLRAKGFLSEQVRDGKKPLRAFAALGLGLWNRARGDVTVHAAVRDAERREMNRDQHGAYLLAMGLGKDPAAVGLLLDVLATDASSWARASAAEALAMIGDAGAREALRGAVDSDSCPYVRGIAAEILAWIGDSTDVDRVIATMRDARTPQDRSRLAAALGRLGGDTARRALRAELDAPELSARVRAAVLAALGIALDDDAARRLAPLGRDANFTVFPDWVRGTLASTL